MSYFFKKSLSLRLFSRFSSEKPLFSSLFSQTSSNFSPFLEISMKTPENLADSLLSQPQLLRNLTFSEKMLVFERFHNSQKTTYSLEFVEDLMQELLKSQETEAFVSKFCDFLEKTRHFSLETAFPEAFLEKLLRKLEELLLLPEETATKWRVIEKIADSSGFLAENAAASRVFLSFFAETLSSPAQTKEKLRVCVRLLGKSREKRFDPRFSAQILLKIEEFLSKDWDSYSDILKIASKCEVLQVSAAFLRKLQEFIIAELEDFPKNGVFLLKQLNFLLYKFEKTGEKCAISAENRSVLLRNLHKHATLPHCEQLLLIFMKTFCENTADFREILAKLQEISWETEHISAKISLLSTVARLLRENLDKRLRAQGTAIFLRVCKEIGEKPRLLQESRDFARLFNALPAVSFDEEQISCIFVENFEVLLVLLKRNCFKFPTLLNILRIFAQLRLGNKHFFVVLEEKLMETIEEFLSVLQKKDLLIIKKSFREAGFGSRKLFIFIEEIAEDLSPGNVKECWRIYKEREAKFKDFKEKKRKSLFYEKLRRGETDLAGK